MIKDFEIISATLEDYPVIQNLARFYAYDLSRSCAFISDDWDFPENGLYESFDSKIYFEDPTRRAFLVRVSGELAGFVLLNQEGTDKRTNWNMSEFFITAKFQGKGLGKQVAHQIWDKHPGFWEISVIPENRPALHFWETTISDYTCGGFNKQIKEVTYDKYQPKRIIFEFDTQNSVHKNTVSKVITRPSQFSDIDAMVSLSKARRLAYEKEQPQFWKYAGEGGDNAQGQWFKELLEYKDYLMFTAEGEHHEILGFVIGKLMPAPEVYNPSGLTLMIDDFCVRSENLWELVGTQLIETIKVGVKDKGVAQILVVCGAHDYPKHKFLDDQNLSISSEWFVGSAV